jgi:hypothetical protein
MRLINAAVVAISALLPLSATIGTAHADNMTFDWTLTSGSSAANGGFTYTGDGTLTATTTATPGVYTITSVSGEVNGDSISLLAPNSFESNDNELFLNEPFRLSGNGVSLLVAGIGDINVFSFGGNGSGNDYGEFGPGGFAGVGVFTAVAATPLPAALPLFATGLGALGFLGWRRQRRVVAA